MQSGKFYLLQILFILFGFCLSAEAAKPEFISTPPANITILRGDAIKLHFEVINAITTVGQQAEPGYVSISFPEIDTRSELPMIAVGEYSGQEEKLYSLKPGIDRIYKKNSWSGFRNYCGVEQTHPVASYLALELEDTNWRPGEQNNVDITFTPTEIGTYTVYYRSAMHHKNNGETDWFCPVIFPNSVQSNDFDQQNWPVEKITIHVTEPPPPMVGIRHYDFSHRIELGNWATINVQIVNLGGPSDNGGISVSFPSFTSPSDSSYVKDNGCSNDLPGYNVYPAGSTIWHRNGNQITASEMLVEFGDANWDSEEINNLHLKFQPQHAGDFTFYIRSAMGLDGEFIGVPISGEVDQQGWNVYKMTISVVKPPTRIQIDNFTGISEESVSFTARLTKATDGSTLQGKILNFRYPGGDCSGTTNSSGSATCEGTPSTGGRVDVSFDGDSDYQLSNGTSSISVSTSQGKAPIETLLSGSLDFLAEVTGVVRGNFAEIDFIREVISSQYEDGWKWFFYVGATSVGCGADPSARIKIDLADYYGITSEGQDGWLTYEGIASFALGCSAGTTGEALTFSLGREQIDYSEPDKLLGFQATGLRLSAGPIISVAGLQAGSSLEDGKPGFSLGGVEASSGAWEAVALETSFTVVKGEMRKETADSLLTAVAMNMLPTGTSGVMKYYAAIQFLDALTDGLSNGDGFFRPFTSVDDDRDKQVDAYIEVMKLIAAGRNPNTEWRLDDGNRLIFPVVKDGLFDPTTWDAQRMYVGLRNTGTNTTDYNVKVVSKPEGWFVAAADIDVILNSFDDSYHLNQVRPGEREYTSWAIAATPGSASSGKIVFEVWESNDLYRDKGTAPLATQTLNVVAGNTVAPSLTVATDGNDVTVNWTSIPGATGYTLKYQSLPYQGDDNFSSLTLEDTSWSSSLPDGSRYAVAVQAYNDYGVSPLSNIENVIIDLSSSLIPPILSAVTNGRNLALSWNPVSGADGYFLRFVPTQEYTGQESFFTYDVGNQANFSIELEPGDRYTLALQAYKGGDISGYSDIVNIIIDDDIDNDNDGYIQGEDCNDHDASIHPGAIDIAGDGIDQNCSGADTEQTSSYDISYQMFRHDVFSNGREHYRGYLAFTKNGLPLVPQDFLTLTVSNSMGRPVLLPWLDDLETFHFISADCRTTPCTWGSPATETGVSFNFGSLPTDDYSIVVDMASEQLITTVPYHTDITVPIISDSSMRNSWQGNDLILSWTNPSNQQNWNKVTMMTIYLYDTTGFSAGIKVSPSENSVIIPAALIRDIKNFTSGELSGWSIITRAYTGDENNSQNARGYSSRVGIQ